MGEKRQERDELDAHVQELWFLCTKVLKNKTKTRTTASDECRMGLSQFLSLLLQGTCSWSASAL